MGYRHESRCVLDSFEALSIAIGVTYQPAAPQYNSTQRGSVPRSPIG